MPQRSQEIEGSLYWAVEGAIVLHREELGRLADRGGTTGEDNTGAD